MKYTRIKYQISKETKLLFIGINPSPGTYIRGVPFSNNKSFWYLLSQAGILPETREELKDDQKLKELFLKRFILIYKLGLMNVIERPSRTISELKKIEALPGSKRIRAAIKKYQPKVVCFVGKTTYRLFAGLSSAHYGWQEPIENSQIFVMHFPLHGLFSVRVRELKIVAQAAGLFPVGKKNRKNK